MVHLDAAVQWSAPDPGMQLLAVLQANSGDVDGVVSEEIRSLLAQPVVDPTIFHQVATAVSILSMGLSSTQIFALMKSKPRETAFLIAVGTSLAAAMSTISHGVLDDTRGELAKHFRKHHMHSGADSTAPLWYMMTIIAKDIWPLQVAALHPAIPPALKVPLSVFMNFGVLNQPAHHLEHPPVWYSDHLKSLSTTLQKIGFLATPEEHGTHHQNYSGGDGHYGLIFPRLGMIVEPAYLALSAQVMEKLKIMPARFFVDPSLMEEKHLRVVVEDDALWSYFMSVPDITYRDSFLGLLDAENIEYENRNQPNVPDLDEHVGEMVVESLESNSRLQDRLENQGISPELLGKLAQYQVSLADVQDLTKKNVCIQNDGLFTPKSESKTFPQPRFSVTSAISNLSSTFSRRTTQPSKRVSRSSL